MGTSNPNNALVADEGRPSARATAGISARLLVIDDELLLGRTLRLAFQENYEVVVVTSGREALELLARDSRFDLVLCDLMMPDMTGMDVYEHVARAYPKLLERLVFMTGGAFTDEARAFLAAHPEAQLEKPFQIARVEALVAASRERHSSAPPLP